MVDDNIQNFLAENKDEIIKIAADKLSEKNYLEQKQSKKR